MSLSIIYLYFSYRAVSKLSASHQDKCVAFVIVLIIGLAIAGTIVALFQWFSNKWKEAKRDIKNQDEFIREHGYGYSDSIGTNRSDLKSSKGVSRYQLAIEQEKDKK